MVLSGCDAANELRLADEKFMRLALEQAKIGRETPGAGEVGCVIVRDGEVVANGYNEAEMRSDPTAHARIVALRRLGAASRAIEFRGATFTVHFNTAQCVPQRVSGPRRAAAKALKTGRKQTFIYC